MLNVTCENAALRDLAKHLEGMGRKLPSAQALVLNRVTTRVKQRIIPTLVRQTGLNKRIFVKAIRTFRASPDNPRAALYARGGEISYRYFSALEKGSGVEAKVRGKVVVIPGGFRRSGPKGRRHIVKRLNGQVYINMHPQRAWGGSLRSKAKGGDGKWLEVQKSGLFIPTEMIEGESLRTFHNVVGTELPNEIARELTKITPGR